MNKDLGLFLGKLFIGASDSIEMISQPLSDKQATLFANYFGIVDSRISKRVIVSFPHGMDTSKKIMGIVWKTGLLKSARCDVRVTPLIPSITAIIIDGTEAVIVDIGKKKDLHRLTYEYYSDEGRIMSFTNHFKRLWYGEKNIIPLYEDLLRFELPQYRSGLISLSNEIWDELIVHLSRNPHEIYSLSPRKFEELVAELLLRQGMDVYLTPPSKDGGYDIMAKLENELGCHLFLVECKRWSKDNPVGIEIVNALYGIVERKKATGGLLVTTSNFTKGAINLQKSLEYRLKLKDYKELCKWLNVCRDPEVYRPD